MEIVKQNLMLQVPYKSDYLAFALDSWLARCMAANKDSWYSSRISLGNKPVRSGMAMKTANQSMLHETKRNVTNNWQIWRVNEEFWHLQWVHHWVTAHKKQYSLPSIRVETANYLFISSWPMAHCSCLASKSDATCRPHSWAPILTPTRLGKIDFIPLHDVCHSHQHIMIEILKLSWSCRCSVGLQQSELSQQAQDWEAQKEQAQLSLFCPEQTGSASNIDNSVKDEVYRQCTGADPYFEFSWNSAIRILCVFTACWGAFTWSEIPDLGLMSSMLPQKKGDL